MSKCEDSSPQLVVPYINLNTPSTPPPLSWKPLVQMRLDERCVCSFYTMRGLSVVCVTWGHLVLCQSWPILQPDPNCCVSAAPRPLDPFASHSAADARRAMCDCPVLWLGRRTDLMFSDEISFDILSLLQTSLCKPSPCAGLWWLMDAFIPVCGLYTVTWRLPGCLQVLVSPVLEHPAVWFTPGRCLESDKCHQRSARPACFHSVSAQ